MMRGSLYFLSWIADEVINIHPSMIELLKFFINNGGILGAFIAQLLLSILKGGRTFTYLFRLRHDFKTLGLEIFNIIFIAFLEW